MSPATALVSGREARGPRARVDLDQGEGPKREGTHAAARGRRDRHPAVSAVPRHGLGSVVSDPRPTWKKPQRGTRDALRSTYRARTWATGRPAHLVSLAPAYEHHAGGGTRPTGRPWARQDPGAQPAPDDRHADDLRRRARPGAHAEDARGSGRWHSHAVIGLSSGSVHHEAGPPPEVQRHSLSNRHSYVSCCTAGAAKAATIA
jgi:hypothetical protein